MGTQSDNTNLFTVENWVRAALETDERARHDDMHLYAVIVEGKLGYELKGLPFERVMNHYAEMGLPHFESVRRTRQKLQAAHEELQPEYKRQMTRLERQCDYNNYAKSYTE